MTSMTRDEIIQSSTLANLRPFEDCQISVKRADALLQGQSLHELFTFVQAYVMYEVIATLDSCAPIVVIVSQLDEHHLHPTDPEFARLPFAAYAFRTDQGIQFAHYLMTYTDFSPL